LFQKVAIGIADTQLKITAPWVRAITHWSVERRELLMNRGKERYINLLRSRRLDATLDLANELERRALATPANASDDVNPLGLPYWASKLMTSGDAGYDANIDKDQDFSGRQIIYGDGSKVINNKAGINPSLPTNAKWRNYVATYTAIDGNFVNRLRRAFHATNFQSPMTVSDLEKGPASQFKIYVGLDELVAYEDLTTKANDNLGPDLDRFHGITTFKRVPILYLPLLDQDPDDAIYGVNHAKFKPFVQEGDWMQESEPLVDVEMPNTITTFINCSYNYICTNVREGVFVLHKPRS
jgi:hypothetical protein